MRIWIICVVLACHALLASDTAGADRTAGAWESPEASNWPLVPVHAALTPDGRVLTFGSNSGGKATGFFIYDVWDPAAGLAAGHVTLDNLTGTDIFCGTAVTLPDSGDIFIAGGSKWTGLRASNAGNNKSTIFDRDDNSLTLGADMKRTRWYASATALMNGEVYVQGGLHGEDFPEVRGRNGSYRLLNEAPTGVYHYNYPRIFVAPDGRVFGFDMNGQMYFVTTRGSGSIMPAGQIDPGLLGLPSTAVMYRPENVLLISGINNRAATVDIAGPAPVVTPTGSLSSTRAWGSATVLADGRVLMTGGSAEPDELVGVNNSAEIWDPTTGQWSMGALGVRPRLYHSFALLLPDASVLVGGGGANNGAPVNNFHAEIYHPPYLYDASGAPAARPVIASAPSLLEPGQPFAVTLDAAGADRVTLVNTGSATHGVNLQQRFVELGFSASGNTLSVDMPARGTDTPPGYYLLFVLDGEGVPSRGRIVRVAVSESPSDDTIAPTKPTGLTITKVQGNPRLVWTASTDNVAVVEYSVHRSTDGSLGPEVVRVPSPTWTDTNVIEGTIYTYAAKAHDAAGNVSLASAKKSVTAYQKPTKPTDFTLRLFNKDPQLNFTPSTDNVGVVGYNVYRSTDGTMGPLFAQIEGPGWVDTSAQAGIRYTYALRARDDAGYLSNATALKGITAK
jgi:hypothetical protein